MQLGVGLEVQAGWLCCGCSVVRLWQQLGWIGEWAAIPIISAVGCATFVGTAIDMLQCLAW